MLVRILSSIALLWAYLPHQAIRPFVHSLVYFLLLLTIETFNVNNDNIFKCVRLVQTLMLVAFMWTCLPQPAIRPFLHFLVHFVLLLTIETINIKDDTIFKCVRHYHRFLSCGHVFSLAIRPFVHF